MILLDSLSPEDAMHKAVGKAPKKREREIVTVDRALGRCLSEDIKVRKTLPAFNNSAMDGFAFRYGDAGRRVRIAATIYAGEHHGAVLKDGECYRIMTGAKVPGDADTIAPIEKCQDVDEKEVTLPVKIKKGDNLRLMGEEIRKGEDLIRAGTLLDPAHIALLGSQGIMAVKVVSRLKIAVLSTGDEIREPWETSGEDEIYNANAFGIIALLERYGFKGEYLGRIPDDFVETEKMISGLKNYDVIITSGGISLGDADYLYDAFVKNGLKPVFHGVNVKPGRPTMMGVMDGSFVMAMPGNPLTTMLNVHALSLPVLRAMLGESEIYHRWLYAVMGEGLKLKKGRSDMVLGKIRDGIFHPTRSNRYGSGMLTPLAESDAVAWVGDETEEIREGELIKVVLLGDSGRTATATAFNR